MTEQINDFTKAQFVIDDLQSINEGVFGGVW